jgi:5-hydroxyisourate hydrolase
MRRCSKAPPSRRGAIGAYFRALGATLDEPPFLDEVPLDFGLATVGAHYHVPLLASPFAYSTYRGS